MGFPAQNSSKTLQGAPTWKEKKLKSFHFYDSILQNHSVDEEHGVFPKYIIPTFVNGNEYFQQSVVLK